MKKWLKISFWVLFSIAVVIGLSMSGSAQKEELTSRPRIFIHVDGENAFLTEDEVHTRLVRKGFIYPGQKFDKLPVKKVEDYLESMSEIKTCRVYQNIGKQWNIDIETRKPIARIFNSRGETFYLDDLGHTMATSQLYTARVVVVTGNIPDGAHSVPVDEIINNDTLKTKKILDDIYRISYYVCNDPLLSAQIGQIHREKNGDFVLIPQVGSHTIVFGSAFSDEEVEEKFKKLKVFYEEGLPYEGWNKYDIINLKYKKQIVCKKINEKEI
ncbi:MAG: cell division protein FtsQ/DivIB [Bacteroidota bacterium]